MSRQQVIDEVADDRVRFMAEFCHHPADEGAAAGVPFKIDGTVKVSSAVDLGPAMRSAGLFCPNFDETEFSFQLRVANDFITERSAPSGDDLDDRLHLSR